MKSGKLPMTQMMTLESNESQWRMLIRNLINELKTSALVEREPGCKVRVNLVITKIIPPEQVRTMNVCISETTLGLNIAVGLSKSKEFLSDYLDKTTWLFIGYIESSEKVPILITYYQSINITIYTQKTGVEDIKKFFPSLN